MTMMMNRTWRTLVAAAAVLLLLVVGGVNGFVVTPRPTAGTVSTRNMRSSINSALSLSTTAAPPMDAGSGVAKAPDNNKPPPRMTAEAAELLSVLDDTTNKDLKIAQVAPSIRVAFHEEFDQALPVSTGQLVAALKELGFDLVLDTNTAADLTICEEGTELLHRVQNKLAHQADDADTKDDDPYAMPLFTSCCPGWLQLVEKSEPGLAQYISTSKSPHMMYGSVIKEFSKELLDQPRELIYFCSVMPCVRKRGESDRSCFVRDDGVREVDNVITTRDLGQLCRMKGINPADLTPVPFDSPVQADGTGSGAGQIFGATGGVMEAAVRSVYELVTGESLPRIDLHEVRGFDGVKEAVIPLHTEDGQGLPIDLRIAVANGLGNAKKLIRNLKDGETSYDFVEVMACPGGCIGGGGQPKGEKGAVEKRMESIYELDRSLPIRRSHENPTIKMLYDEYLGEYGGDRAHELLHVDPVYGETDLTK